MTEPQAARALPVWLTVVLGVAGAAVALWGIRGAAWILAPVVLAFVLAVTVHPLIGVLARRGLRRGLAIAIAVVVVDGGLIAFVLVLFVSIGQLATVLPDYADEWQHQLDELRSTLTGWGIGPQQVQDALKGISPAKAISALAGVLTSVAGSVGALVLVLATAVFMIAESSGVPARLAQVAGAARLNEALAAFARNTRRYLVVTSVFGFAVAVVDTLALVILGIPLALLWGLVSFLTNYVPNIGFLLGLAPPTLLALLVSGPGLAILVIVIYSVVNFVLQSVVQPIFVGDAVGLSVTVTFLSVIVWTVVLGPLGAILAIPLTLFLHAVLVGQDPARPWARVLLAGASGAAAESRPRRGRRERRSEQLPEPRPEPQPQPQPMAAPEQPAP
jgi:predicted PurR-regulated permease PerM